MEETDKKAIASRLSEISGANASVAWNNPDDSNHDNEELDASLLDGDGGVSFSPCRIGAISSGGETGEQ